MTSQVNDGANEASLHLKREQAELTELSQQHLHFGVKFLMVTRRCWWPNRYQWDRRLCGILVRRCNSSCNTTPLRLKADGFRDA